MAPWTDFCYKRPSHLIIGGRRLSSEHGIQQGDPLGPWLFALAQIAREATEKSHPGKLDFVTFFLDDGIVAGEAEAVRFFVDHFERAVRDLGLSASVDKCEVVPAAGDDTEVPRDCFPGWHWTA